MKHICTALCALLAFSLALAGQVPVSGPAREEAQETRAKTKVAEPPTGFFNTTVGILLGTHKSPDSRFAEVFGDKTSLQFGANLSRTLLYLKGFELDLSLEARAVSKTGQATLSGDETKFSMIPLSAAGRLLYHTKYVTPLIGAGGDSCHFKETSVLADTSGWAKGYHYQAGLLIVVPGAERLRIKLYYRFTKISGTANEITVKLGGPEYGIGLSYGFNFLNRASIIIR